VILSARRLNRALLARQLLLERSRGSLVEAVERMGGIQAQYAPSAYIGLWSRLDGFELADLTRALERRRVVQGTTMRSTIHIVSRADYWPFVEAIRRDQRARWERTHKRLIPGVDMKKATGLVRKALADGPRHRDELVALVGGTSAWNGIDLDLVRVPPSGTWERRRADLYALAEDWVGPSEISDTDALVHTLRRYLAAFGPATLNEAADWAGVNPTTLRSAAESLKLRAFEDEDGRTLLDVPRAPLPDEAVPAPPRFLPTWDATLLVHARRTQILPERFRPRVFNTKTPNSTPTFLVDGAVAGAWRVERTKTKATLVLAAFEPLPHADAAALREEAERLVRLVAADAGSHAVRTGRA
jgi:hypothetical protein